MLDEARQHWDQHKHPTAPSRTRATLVAIVGMRRGSNVIDDEVVLALSPVASFQDLGEEGGVVLLADTGQLYTCNDTTTALLKAIDGTRPFGKILGLMLDEFEVTPDVLRTDLAGLVDELLAERIVEVVGKRP